MAAPHQHKSKTRATLLAAVLGGPGLHRFYLYGMRDFWAWNYVGGFALFVCALILTQSPHSLGVTILALFPFAMYAGLIEAMVIGLTPDDKWDAKHNAQSGRQSGSGWPIPVILVLAFAAGFTGLITGIARTIDLFLTGGAFG